MNMARWNVQELQGTDWFGPLVEQIKRELEARSADRLDKRPALVREREQLGQQLQGWSLSLSKPDLSPTVRARIESDVEATLRRLQEIESQLGDADALQRCAETILKPEPIMDRINRLAEVLDAQNASRTNLELSLHIDVIRCFQAGRVVVRTCKLGALAGSIELLARPEEASTSATAGNGEAIAAKPRRRAVRRVAAGGSDQAELQAAAHHAADVHRFAGLEPEWFWEDSFQLPRKTYWPEQHAAEVAAKKQETKWSLENLAKHFHKSVPTIRKALRRAQEIAAQQPDNDKAAG
jgi:hypothetical protein